MKKLKKQGKTPRRKATGWIVTIGVLLGLFIVSGVAYAFDVASNQGKVPRATSVGGVDISLMERPAAVAKLTEELGSVETKPVTVRAGERSSQFVPKNAGLSLNFQEVVDGIPDAPMNPIARVASFFQPATEVEVKYNVDDAALAPELDRVAEELAEEPKDGALTLENGEFKVFDPIIGQKVDRVELESKVKEEWLNPQGIELAAQEVEPAINAKAIEDMRNGEAATALGSDIVVHGEGDVTATLDRAALSRFVSVSAKDGALRLNVDTEAAQSILAELLAPSEVKGTNATISYVGGSRQITPSVDGRVVDWEKTMEGFEDRVRSDDKAQRTFAATYKQQPAAFTTEMAEKATFDQVVGEFTTTGYSAASGENIRLTANLVNGAIVAPGETFSLNGYTGPRGTAQGFVESGIIIDGHAGKAVGGGISQFATTLYNAAYFAGMQDVAHTPHSYYISRYPAGREATVYEGAIDLKFKNTSPYPVRIDTQFGGGAVTVRIMGVKTVNVTSTNNGRWAETQPKPIELSGEDCFPSSGAPGFTTSDTRTITDLSGNVVSQETTTTVYDPQPIVKCTA